jgi:hypothetical protein
MWTSFSTVAGGGVRGKGVGIARKTIVRVGSIIKTFPLFIERYPQAGGMTTGSIVGEGGNGTTNEYPSNKFTKTGTTGKRIDIGRGKIHGASRV